MVHVPDSCPEMGSRKSSCVSAPLGIEVGKVGNLCHPVAIRFADIAHICAQLHEKRRRGLRPVVDQRLRPHNPKVITSTLQGVLWKLDDIHEHLPSWGWKLKRLSGDFCSQITPGHTHFNIYLNTL